MSNGSPDPPGSPLEDARQTWADVRPLFAELLGEDAMVAVESQLDVSVFVTAPHTFIARIADAAVSSSRNSPPDLAILAGVLAPAIARLEQMKNENARASAPYLAHPAGAALKSFLELCASKLPVEDVAAAIVVPRTFAPDALIKSGQNPFAGAGAAEPFEAFAGRTATQLKKLAESFYGPMLVPALTLTRMMRGKPVPIPSELGKVMGQCRNLWESGGGPIALLVPEIRFIRNAEAHESIEYDVRNETVTFLNENADGTVERLGPWDRRQLGEFVGTFM